MKSLRFLNQHRICRSAELTQRLIFALDATASRQPTWATNEVYDIATELQAEMFRTAKALGGLSLQLCYFRGLGEFFASGWHEKCRSDSLLQLMAGIQCQAEEQDSA